MVMQKLSFLALLDQLLDPKSERSNRHLFLCDSPLVERLLEEENQSRTGTSLQKTDKIADASELVENLATPPLFDEPRPALLLLPNKLSKSQWTQLEKSLQRLVDAPDASVLPPLWMVGGTALRRVVGEARSCTVSLTYSPPRHEWPRCAEKLMSRYSFLQQQAATKRDQTLALALQCYESDFVMIDNHFKRMNEAELPFEEVFLDSPEVSVYQFVDAVSQGDTAQVVSRLRQCQKSGEQAGRVLSALHSHLRQLLRFVASRKAGQPEREVFQKLGIPFPAQAKFSAAEKHIPLQKALKFLRFAPQLEIQLRQSPHAYDLLCIEVSELLS